MGNLLLLEHSFLLRKKNQKSNNMGQKVNPIIFRINKTNEWKSKYFEKKITDSSILNFNDIEIKKFIYQFFKFKGFAIKDLKLSHLNNTLNIFISYFSLVKSVQFNNSLNNNQKIKLRAKRKIKEEQEKIFFKTYSNTKNYLGCEDLTYLKILKTNRIIQTSKIILNENQNKLKIRRIHLLNYYKNYLKIKQYKNFSKVKNNLFLTDFFESLNKFTNNKTNINITISKINTNIKKIVPKKKIKILKKKTVKLRKYEQNKFFKEGVNVLFLCLSNKNSAQFLSNFIAFQLQKLKRHNFFLRFIKSTLMFFHNKPFSTIKGIKIKIKGRFNGAPRARHRFLLIGKNIPTLTINSKIDYAEATSFTTNGTFGVKVWICDKKFNNKLLCL